MRIFYDNGCALVSSLDFAYALRNNKDITIREIVKSIVPVNDYCDCRNDFLIIGNGQWYSLHNDGDKKAADVFGECISIHIIPDW